MMRAGLLVAMFLTMPASIAVAQGQDSTPWERDLQVVGELIQGSFDNANQAYFDFRTGRETKHRRIHVDVERIDAPNIGDYVFIAHAYWGADESDTAARYLWVLAADNDAQAVRMSASAMAGQEVEAGMPGCDILWRREAAQFKAKLDGDCDLAVPVSMALSEKQLWMAWAGEQGGPYEMHRTRAFECYADIPGVGGGGAIPYDRYDGFRIHDQGGAATFTSKEGREISISLLLVDWPINNYEGVFSRDSLVIYVNENTEEGRKAHGYSFTVPEADRIGINLQWMLAFCYMTSNADATPYM